MCVWGGGAHQLQCKSESAQCSEKQSPCEGEGGLQFENKNAGKIGHMVPCILYFFIHPQPNNIGPAWQQPRALFLISLGLVGGG